MRLGVLAAVLVSSAIAAGLVAKHVLMRLGQSKSLDGVLARVPDYLSAAVPSNPDLAPMRHFSGSAEGQMEIVYGKIREILPGIEGMMCGFVIDGGLEVNFPKDVAKRVSGVVALGSRLEICGHPFRGRSGEPRLDAEFITNLDLNRSINLHAAPPMDKPEVPSSSSPTSNEAAPLVPPARGRDKDKELSGSRQPKYPGPGSAEFGYQNALPAKPPMYALPKDSPENSSKFSHADREGAARSIELAYDGWHRAQALMADVRVADLRSPDVSQLFQESKHTYQQAVSSYQRKDYAVAGEFASASGELSRSVEIVASTVLREESDSHATMSPPSEPHADVLNSAETQSGFARVGKLLARLHWLVQNGTLPNKDREQVRRIASWSEALYIKSQQSWKAGAFAEASYSISAAEAVAQSAEHICRQDYLARVSATN
ncbi:MAG: hypothetical protein WCA15_02190 [Candidatus Acidiferrales bacterium]